MKRSYTTPEIEFVEIDAEDIIMTSGTSSNFSATNDGAVAEEY